nr:uncharacterized protein LOC113808361 [Penaeus vannamei]
MNRNLDRRLKKSSQIVTGVEENSAEAIWQKKKPSIAKARSSDRRDMGTTVLIKDKNGNILMKDEDIKQRWRDYSTDLLNNGNQYQRTSGMTNTKPRDGRILERVMDQRLRGQVNIHENQFGIMPGRSTVDATEKFLQGNRKFYYCFVDLEKACDRVPRQVVYWCLRTIAQRISYDSSR